MFHFFLISIFFFLINCSFDNKTGIWKDASKVGTSTIKDIGSLEKNKKIYKKSNTITQAEYDIYCKGTFSKVKKKCRFKISNDRLGEDRPILEKVFTNNLVYELEKDIDLGKIIKLDKPEDNPNYSQQFLADTNNVSNNFYSNNNLLISKTSKVGKFNAEKVLPTVIYYNNKIISSDRKGNIYSFSLENNKQLWKFNFYKKAFKKFKKEIYFIIRDNKLFVADNLGYLYAINFEDGSLIWAKNYGIPFRSNVKFANNDIYLANIDNTIYSINSNSGEQNWQFSTSPTFLKTNFKNNIAIDELNKSLVFLNTSGELYSINYVNRQINWVLNFNSYSTPGDVNIFLSKPIVIKDKTVLVSTKTSLLGYDTLTGARKWAKPLAPKLKPVINNNNVFLFSKKNLLICLEVNTGEILWSKNIYNQIRDKKLLKKKKKKIGNINNIVIAGDKINLFSSEGYLFSFNFFNGKIKNYKKISQKGIVAEPLFVNNHMFIIDKSNKLLKFN